MKTVYNNDRDAYIEFDISDTLKNFINDAKNLYNISCISVRLYDINDMLDHHSKIEDIKCHELEVDSWDDDDKDLKQYITNVDIDAYDYNTWKDYENLMIAKTVNLVDGYRPNQDIYTINTGLKWKDYEDIILQIFVDGLKDRIKAIDKEKSKE